MSTFKTSDGVELFYKDWGAGRPVVLIHGWPLNSDSFDSLALNLADNGYRAIAFDRRGFGRSDQPFAGYDYDRLADDLSDLIETLKLEAVTLAGFSMGGGEVARYLSRHGAQRIDKVVLISSVLPCLGKRDDHPAGVSMDTLNEIEAGLREDRPAFLGKFFKQFYGVGMLSHPVSEEVLRWSQQMAMQAGLLPTVACARAFGGTDFRAELRSITMPTLVLHGTADETVPIDATAREMAEAIPGAILLEYEGHAHGVLETARERVARDVLAFLRDPLTMKLQPEANLSLAAQEGMLLSPAAGSTIAGI